MNTFLHITGGDACGGSLKRAGLPGEVFVWHDILYEGPRNPGWPTEATLDARAGFLERATGGGLGRRLVRDTLARQYGRLAAAGGRERVVLWFDACLFDMAMLVHVLACLRAKAAPGADLLVVDAFPGVEPYDGLGQLTPAQLASVFDRRQPVAPAQWGCAVEADRAFALQDAAALARLAGAAGCPLPWLPAAARRWLEEQPDPETGLGRLERTALEAVRAGEDTPVRLFKAVAARETHPQFWGDTTLWAKLNGLADRGRVRIEGPAPRLPQWEGQGDLALFRVTPG